MATSRKEAVLGDALHESPFRRKVSRADFPPSLVFGVATSAYQIEGACKEGGRGASIWDAFSHTEGKVIDGSNGDVAVDHYHRYKEDIDIVSKFGFNGLGTNVNEEGIAFYNDLISYIVEKGIEPYVTLYHWDLPLHLDESIGGWVNKQIVMVHHLISKGEEQSYRKWAEASSDKVEDKVAAARHVEFQTGWFLDPLYHGDYPKVMQELLGELLPKFTAEDKELLKSSMDFIGLNN